MKISTYAADAADTRQTLSRIGELMPARLDDARMVFAFYGCSNDDAQIAAFLDERAPRAALIGGTSSGGLMTEKGVFGPNGVGFLVIEDADGDYGAAAARLGGDPEAAAMQALRAALESCDCVGQLPDLIWVYQSPGHEEAVMQGLRRIVGDRCPIVGGSSADDAVAGQWRQFGPDGAMEDSLVVAVLFPSVNLGVAFQGGYEPAGPNGAVTRLGFHPAGGAGVVTSAGSREILQIDGEPAAEVYDRWTDHAISGRLDDGRSILQETTMFPLATEAGKVDGVTHYLLIHPESVTPGHGLKTFRDIEPGARIYAMRGDRERLIERAGRVATQARTALAGAPISGSLVVYCGGCKLAVDEEIGRVAQSVNDALDGAPFIGCFTFGEQGYLIDRSVHGNLMISAIAFGG